VTTEKSGHIGIRGKLAAEHARRSLPLHSQSLWLFPSICPLKRAIGN
jgi:hypothetical protein